MQRALSPVFPQQLSTDEKKKKKAALKGRMLGGTTNGKPGSLGHGDTGIGRTVGVPSSEDCITCCEGHALPGSRPTPKAAPGPLEN